MWPTVHALVLATGIYCLERWAGVLISGIPERAWLVTGVGLVGLVLTVEVVRQFSRRRKEASAQQQLLDVAQRLDERGLELSEFKAKVARLPQERLSDSATFAELPDGARVVTLANGSIRLALPIVLSASFAGEARGKLRIDLQHRRKDEGNRP